MRHLRLALRSVATPSSVFATALLVALALADPADAARLTLTWMVNSTNESGFAIERREGPAGAFNEIARVAAGQSTFTDTSLADGTSYCYRVRAFNGAGQSPYTSGAGGVRPPATSLTAARAGTGRGAVWSRPAGIACGTDCSEAFASGTQVTLTATATTGSTFAGWSGDSDCTDGVVNMTGVAKTCRATFNLAPASGGGGPAADTNLPSPANAARLTLTWTDNSANESGFAIERRVSPTGSFSEIARVAVGQSTYTDTTLAVGTSYCYRVRAFNAVGLSPYTNEACAVGSPGSPGISLTVARAGTGSGTVASSPAGISCGADCSEAFASGTQVTLMATATTGSTFAGWSGDSDCTDGVVSMTGAKTCTATFN